MSRTAAGITALITLPIGLVAMLTEHPAFFDESGEVGVFAPIFLILIIGGISLVIFGASKKDD